MAHGLPVLSMLSRTQIANVLTISPHARMQIMFSSDPSSVGRHRLVHVMDTEEAVLAYLSGFHPWFWEFFRPAARKLPAGAMGVLWNHLESAISKPDQCTQQRRIFGAQKRRPSSQLGKAVYTRGVGAFDVNFQIQRRAVTMQNIRTGRGVEHHGIKQVSF